LRSIVRKAKWLAAYFKNIFHPPAGMGIGLLARKDYVKNSGYAIRDLFLAIFA